LCFEKRRKILHHQQQPRPIRLLFEYSEKNCIINNNINNNRAGNLLSFNLLHGFIGRLVLLLSVWFVGVWLMSPLMVVPVKMQSSGGFNRRLMPVVLFLWLASLVLSFLLHATLHA
jgi:hypothetical protein